jgi:hypothetical protein
MWLPPVAEPGVNGVAGMVPVEVNEANLGLRLREPDYFLWTYGLTVACG